MSVSTPHRPQAARTLNLLPANHRPLPKTVAEGLPRTVHHELGVPTIDRRVVDFANFDHGATAPALVSVQQAVETVQRTYGSVHRGAGYTSRLTTGWFEQARAEVGRFVGARTDDHVVFTRNTTDALRLLAHALPATAEVFAWSSAHHAALLPWPAERTHVLPVPTSAEHAQVLAADALATSDAPEKLLVVTGACNVTGEIWPVAELTRIAREFGARVVLDAAQLAPHRLVDIEAWDVDYVAFSGHKAYAPYGTGALVGRPDWLDAAAPYFPAGGATRAVSADAVTWTQGPSRHEGGTPNAVGAIALAAACSALRRHHVTVAAQEHSLHARLREGLKAIPGVHTVDVLGPEQPNVGVVTFTVEGYDPSLVSQVLADEHGIAVRDGKFCAHRLCDTVIGGPAVRASLGLATTVGHVERLLTGVQRLVDSGPLHEYLHTADGWVAQDDPRLLDEPRPW